MKKAWLFMLVLGFLFAFTPLIQASDSSPGYQFEQSYDAPALEVDVASVIEEVQAISDYNLMPAIDYGICSLDSSYLFENNNINYFESQKNSELQPDNKLGGAVGFPRLWRLTNNKVTI